VLKKTKHLKKNYKIYNVKKIQFNISMLLHTNLYKLYILLNIRKINNEICYIINFGMSTNMNNVILYFKIGVIFTIIIYFIA